MSHSAGNFAVDERNRRLFGSAYNAQTLADEMYQINGQQSGSVVYSMVHRNDWVGTLLGGNAATGGQTPSGSNWIWEAAKLPFADETSHSSYFTVYGKINSKDDDLGKLKSYWGGTPGDFISLFPNVKR